MSTEHVWAERDRLKREVERLTTENASLREAGRVAEKELEEMRAERDRMIGTYKGCRRVLQEAGVPCQFGEGGVITADEGFPRDLADCLKSLIAERDEARKEISDIRENCYYACVSKKTAQADINRVAKDFQDVADYWRERATAAEADRSVLLSALGSIQGTLKQGFGDKFMINRVENLVAETLGGPARGEGEASR